MQRKAISQAVLDAQALQRARAAYHNTDYPERWCDRCGQLYQGPAVYCSLACALADTDPVRKAAR